MKEIKKNKPSNIEWIGNVPINWKIGAVKHCFKFKVGFTPPTVDADFYDEEGFEWVTISDLIEKVVSKSKNKISQKAVDVYSKEIVPKGSLLYSFKLSVGKVAFAGKDIFTNEAIFSILPDENLELSYYYYCLPTILIHNANNNIYGAKIFNQEVIKNSRLPIPPKNEQTQIARFLDYQTEVIDDLIKQKEKLIELLKEKRQAVINEAVTKGLDPRAKMKESGIEWLGVIPNNWTPSKIKFVATIKGRIGYKGYTKDDIVSEGEGALTLGAKHIDKNNNLNLSDPEYISWEKYNESPEIMVKLNDVIFTQRGSLGKICHINVEIPPATINPSMVILTATKISPRYLYYWLTADRIQNEVELLQSSTAVPMISQFQLSNFPVIIPPLDEQAKIVKFIDNSIESFNKMINDNIKLIESLREYRQSLISEAVTGKIDVRDWQPKKQAVA